MTDHGESFNIIRGIEIEALFVASLEWGIGADTGADVLGIDIDKISV